MTLTARTRTDATVRGGRGTWSLRPRMRVPLLLLLAGLVLGRAPEPREIALPQETVLLVPLLVALVRESLTTSLRSIERDLRTMVIMSTPLVVATESGLAGTAHAAALT